MDNQIATPKKMISLEKNKNEDNDDALSHTLEKSCCVAKRKTATKFFYCFLNFDFNQVILKNENHF